MAVFQFFKMAASSILDFSTMEILTAEPVRRANMHQRAKFRVDRVNRCGDMTVFQFFKTAAVYHLGF